MMEHLFADRHGTLYRLYGVVPVGPPDRNAWAECLSGKLHAAGVDITPPALARLLDLTRGHPDEVRPTSR